MQATVEAAIRQEDSLCGAFFDIEKCFNNIPRSPILFLAMWLGVDTRVVHAWSSFLCLMHRSFMVHGQPSDVVFSDTGLPEGDSMSCLGMVLLTFSYHFYLHHFQPQITELSYVDNLEFLGPLPRDVLSGFISLSTWADLFKLGLDLQKSACWAVKAQDRRLLHVLGLPVVDSASDLHGGFDDLWC